MSQGDDHLKLRLLAAADDEERVTSKSMVEVHPESQE